eukprot:m.646516 g.646516  ORF g.646516 m.646516 type:complete len:58 (-) comp22651_c0_seq71:2806-2979(-)
MRGFLSCKQSLVAVLLCLCSLLQLATVCEGVHNNKTHCLHSPPGSFHAIFGSSPMRC